MDDFERAFRSLLEKLKKMRSTGNETGNTPVPIRRIVQEFSSSDSPISWIRARDLYPRFFWSDRSGNSRWATWGTALEAGSASTEFSENDFLSMKKVLDISDPDLRWYGGLRFQQDAVPDKVWKKMGKYRFVIPRLEVHQKDRKGLLVFNLLDSDDPQALADKLSSRFKTPRNDQDGSVKSGGIMSREDIPSRRNWGKMMAEALKAIREDKFSKIVLARKSEFQFCNEVDPLLLLGILQQRYSNSFCFFLQPDRNFTFLGVTPEMLYSRNDRDVICDAIAGSAPRGEDEIEDARLGNELLVSGKNLSEHRWVVQDIETRIRELCASWEITEREKLLKLKFIQHIFTRFTGRLRKDVSDFDIISALHPTPAVAGYPRNESLRHISRLEEFDRGWYAAPIGWFSNEAACFAVALRSAVLKEKILTTYAGAGIVSGSEAENEWQEIENKIMNYTNILAQL